MSGVPFSQRSGYVNWVKAAELLLYLKEGLETFVADGMNNLHEKILDEIRQNLGLEPGKPLKCDQCTTNNATPCVRSNSVCDRVGKCKFHDPDREPTKKRDCPNGICHNIPAIIRKQHYNKSPNYSCTDATQWCEEPWQIAKCFLTTNGNDDADTIQDIDCAGLLSIIINCKFLKVNEKNVFRQARDARNAIMHNPSCDIGDGQLKIWADLLIAPLEDTEINPCYAQVKQATESMTKVLETEYIITDKGKEEAKRIENEKKNRRTRLQKFLKETYNRHLRNVPISPLLRNISVDIEDVYTDLVIKERKPNRGSSVPSHVCIQEYKDLFGGKKNIFLVGEAGVGKTTWCFRLIHHWLNALGKTNMTDNERFLLQFEFIFFVSLPLSKDELHLNDMIDKQLFSGESDLMDTAKEILTYDSEKCLIVLDGLDEWCPSAKSSTLDQTGLPLRTNVANVTVLTTTRPWTLERLRLPGSELGKTFDIQGIQKEDIFGLANTIITKLNECEYMDEDRTVNDFQDCIRGQAGQAALMNLLEMPFLLTSVVCVWYETGVLDKNLTNIYSQLVEIFIRSAMNTKQIMEVQNLYTDEFLDNLDIPAAISKGKCTKQLAPLLINIGKLAFQGLLATENEGLFVLTTEMLSNYMSAKEVDIALRIGIISKSEVFGSVLETKFSVSFLNKTVQEYLAAAMVDSDCVSYIHKIREILSSVSKIKQYANFVKLLLGLSKGVSIPLLEHVCSITPDLRSPVGLKDYKSVLFLPYVRELGIGMQELTLQHVVLVGDETDSMMIEYMNSADYDVTLYAYGAVGIAPLENVRVVRNLCVGLDNYDGEKLCELIRTLVHLKHLHIFEKQRSLSKPPMECNIFNTLEELECIYMDGYFDYIFEHFSFPKLKEVVYKNENTDTNSFIINALNQSTELETVIINKLCRSKAELDLRKSRKLRKLDMINDYCVGEQLKIILDLKAMEQIDYLAIKRSNLVIEHNAEVDADPVILNIREIQLRDSNTSQKCMDMLLEKASKLQQLTLYSVDCDVKVSPNCLKLDTIELVRSGVDLKRCTVDTKCLQNITCLKLNTYCLVLNPGRDTKTLNITDLSMTNVTLDGIDIGNLLNVCVHLINCTLWLLGLPLESRISFAECKHLKNLSIDHLRCDDENGTLDTHFYRYILESLHRLEYIRNITVYGIPKGLEEDLNSLKSGLASCNCDFGE